MSQQCLKVSLVVAAVDNVLMFTVSIFKPDKVKGNIFTHGMSTIQQTPTSRDTHKHFHAHMLKRTHV